MSRVASRQSRGGRDAWIRAKLQLTRDWLTKRGLSPGGGSGIGAAFTRAFAAQGARVGFVDIAEEASRTLIAKIRKETGTAPLFIACDIRDIAALQAAIEKTRAELGDIGVLINNAGNDDRHALDTVTP